MLYRTAVWSSLLLHLPTRLSLLSACMASLKQLSFPWAGLLQMSWDQMAYVSTPLLQVQASRQLRVDRSSQDQINKPSHKRGTWQYRLSKYLFEMTSKILPRIQSNNSSSESGLGHLSLISLTCHRRRLALFQWSIWLQLGQDFYVAMTSSLVFKQLHQCTCSFTH